MQALNLAAYVVIAVIIILTALTVWAVVKDEKDGDKNNG